MYTMIVEIAVIDSFLGKNNDYLLKMNENKIRIHR